MMLAGLMTPMASAALIGTMSQAIQAVHADKGPWASEGGWEYNVVIMAAAFAIADTGPGDISLDHALGLDRFHGPSWALAALAAGAAGPALLIRREQPQAAGAQAQAEPSAQSSDTLAA
jgi:putative oxidoreductase